MISWLVLFIYFSKYTLDYAPRGGCVRSYTMPQLYGLAISVTLNSEADEV